MPGYYSDEIIQEVKEGNDVVDVISEYLQLKRTGSNFKGLCPFHNEKTPSFVVSPSKQIFHCFGCGESGNVINFIMKYQNVSFPEALELLADRVGIQLQQSDQKEYNRKRKKKDKLLEINRETARYFYRNLSNNDLGHKYLLNRGINNDTIKTFGLGYAKNSWEDLLKYLLHKGFTQKDIEESGLIIKRKKMEGYYDRFRNRVMFPIIDVKGNVIGFGGRVIDDGQPKYLNSPETPVFSKGYNLYGLNIAKKYARNDKIILVEGYMDVISLYKFGIKNCVASLGTALTKDQVKLLKRYSDKFYICYDNDNAGINAANKAIDVFKKQGLESHVVILPEKGDPDEYIGKHGKEAFYKVLDNPYNYIDFKIYMYKKKYDISDLDNRIHFTREISKMLKNINSPIERDAYVSRISEDTNISEEAIRKEMSNKNSSRPTTSKDKYIKYNNRNNNKDSIKPVSYSLEPGHLIAEKKLLKLLIDDKNIYNRVKDNFKPESFFNDLYRKIATNVYDMYEKGLEVNSDELLDCFNDDKDINTIKKLIKEDIQISNSEKIKAVKDFINKINYYKLKIKRQKIKDQIRNIETNDNKGDVGKFEKLCMELIKIDKELKLHQ